MIHRVIESRCGPCDGRPGVPLDVPAPPGADPVDQARATVRRCAALARVAGEIRERVHQGEWGDQADRRSGGSTPVTGTNQFNQLQQRVVPGRTSSCTFSALLVMRGSNH